MTISRADIKSLVERRRLDDLVVASFICSQDKCVSPSLVYLIG